MARRFRPFWLDALLTLLVTGVSAITLGQAAARVGYNTDEGQFIAASGYFQVLFVERRLSGPPWEPAYWTLTQPPMAHYLLGVGLWARGIQPPALNLRYREAEVNPATRARYLERETYRDERRIAEERRIDRPSQAVLEAARAPMLLLAALGVGALYVLGRVLAGPIAGLSAACLLLLTPAMQTLLPRAHAEAPLLFFSVTALLAAVLAARTAPRPAALGWGGLCGLCAGLAAASKLTGMLEVLALGTLAVGAMLAWFASGGRDRLSARTWQWAGLAAGLALLVFVAVNPFLYRDPIGRTRAMLEFRQQEMFGQVALNEAEAVDPQLMRRLALVVDRTFQDLAPISRRTGLALDVALALLGTAGLALRTARLGFPRGAFSAEAVFLVWTVVVGAGLAVNLGLDWSRYYMPTLTLAAVLAGVGVATLVGGIRRFAQAAR